jgi:hypothetical protein
LTFKCGLFGKSSLTLTLTIVPQARTQLFPTVMPRRHTLI